MKKIFDNLNNPGYLSMVQFGIKYCTKVNMTKKEFNDLLENSLSNSLFNHSGKNVTLEVTFHEYFEEFSEEKIESEPFTLGKLKAKHVDQHQMKDTFNLSRIDGPGGEITKIRINDQVK